MKHVDPVIGAENGFYRMVKFSPLIALYTKKTDDRSVRHGRACGALTGEIKQNAIGVTDGLQDIAKYLVYA